MRPLQNVVLEVCTCGGVLSEEMGCICMDKFIRVRASPLITGITVFELAERVLPGAWMACAHSMHVCVCVCVAEGSLALLCVAEHVCAPSTLSASSPSERDESGGCAERCALGQVHRQSDVKTYYNTSCIYASCQLLPWWCFYSVPRVPQMVSATPAVLSD